MAISRAGSPTSVNNGANYTAEAGSNRVVAFAIRVVAGSTQSITGVTFGGTACTIAVQYMETGSEFGLVGVAYIKEANIPSGAQAVSVTVSGGTVDPIICSTLTGVDQTTSTRDTDSQEVTATSSFAITLTTQSGDYGILAGFSGFQGAGAFLAYNNGWVEDSRSDLGGAGGRTVVAASVACDGTDNVSITHSGNARKSVAVAIFAADAGGGAAVKRNNLALAGMGR